MTPSPLAWLFCFKYFMKHNSNHFLRPVIFKPQGWNIMLHYLSKGSVRQQSKLHECMHLALRMFNHTAPRSPPASNADRSDINICLFVGWSLKKMTEFQFAPSITVSPYHPYKGIFVLDSFVSRYKISAQFSTLGQTAPTAEWAETFRQQHGSFVLVELAANHAPLWLIVVPQELSIKGAVFKSWPPVKFILKPNIYGSRSPA